MESLKTLISTATSLADGEWKRFETLLSAHVYKKGELLQREGEVAHDLFFIEKGWVKYCYIDVKGNEFIKEFTGPGEFSISLNSVVLGQPSKLRIEAIQSVQAWRIPYKKFQALAAQSMGLMKFHLHYLERRFMHKEMKEIQFLSLNGSERYALFKKERAELFKTLTGAQIASYLGITTVQLSRIRSKNRRKG